MRQRKTIFFTEAEKRLKELELEKQKLDAELKAAQEKISKTETNTQALHVQLRVGLISVLLNQNIGIFA